MKHLLSSVAVCALAAGLWDHDWRLILAGACVAAIWPLISADVESAAHEGLLDELWGEDE